MRNACNIAFGFLACLLASCGGGGGGSAAISSPEEQCQALGWQRAAVPAGGLDREVLWKAPDGGAWTRGALIVMHGGGGSFTNFCVANVALIEPQVRFTAQALAEGFAVFLLDSTDQVTDSTGCLIGKVWDDEVNVRPNLDLPFLDQVLGSTIPSNRPAGSRTEIFLAGHSSGGYMAARVASVYGDRISAFASVSSGDPYGSVRVCTPKGDRSDVFGVVLDAETGLNIAEPGACSAAAYPNERPWDSSPGGAKPPFRLFHHEQDGVNDLSCAEKVAGQLVARGYPETAAFRLSGSSRDAALHSWLDAYNTPLLAFFSGFL